MEPDIILRGLKATYGETQATHQDVERLLPLLELLEETEGESPIMAILAALGEMAAAIQGLDARMMAIGAKVEYLVAESMRHGSP